VAGNVKQTWRWLWHVQSRGHLVEHLTLLPFAYTKKQVALAADPFRQQQCCGSARSRVGETVRAQSCCQRRT
jgi:hypothetical protein